MNTIGLSIGEVQSLTGIGRTMIYELINSNQLKARKLNSKTIILKCDLEEFLNNLERYKPKKGEGHA